jgi:hypothetical protein
MTDAILWAEPRRPFWAEIKPWARSSPLGRPRPSRTPGFPFGLLTEGADVMLTSAGFFLKNLFLFCLKIPENVFDL